jgi:hypothetical protein
MLVYHKLRSLSIVSTCNLFTDMYVRSSHILEF